MLKILKSNIESRKIALIEGSQQVSLFHYKSVKSVAYYLNQYQKVMLTVELNQVLLLHVTEGLGELEVIAPQNPLRIQLISSDILLLPEQHQYHITNITEQQLTIAVTVITQ